MGSEIQTSPQKRLAAQEQENPLGSQERIAAQTSERLREPLQQNMERLGLRQSESTTAKSSNGAKSPDLQPVFFDQRLGWYQKDAQNQVTQFNPGAQPVYNGHDWVKPFDATPPKSNTIRVAPETPPRPESDRTAPSSVSDRPQTARETYHPPEQNAAISIHSKEDFNRLVLNAKGPVLVDFGATWCGPCRAMAPKVDGLAREFSGRAAVYKVDADEARDWVGAYAQSYPTLTVFDRNQPPQTFLGNQEPSGIRNTLNARLQQMQVDEARGQGQQPIEQKTLQAPPKSEPVPGQEVSHTRPLAPFEQSGFHSPAERDAFEKFASQLGYTPQQISHAEEMNPQEWACFNSINRYRMEQRMSPLQFSPKVKLVSDYQAARQASGRQMTHGDPGRPYNHNYPYHLDRLGRVGLGADGMHDGENAAMGMVSGAQVTNAWLHSAGHLRPIRDPYLKIGAVSCTPSPEGTPYWTFNASTGQERARFRKQ